MLYEVIKVEVTGGRVVTGAIAGVLAALRVTEDGDKHQQRFRNFRRLELALNLFFCLFYDFQGIIYFLLCEL